MKERPILFSAPMVRAILDGSKTQTRRLVKVPRRGAFALADFGVGWWPYESDDGESIVCNDGNERPMGSPFGAPGDRLWVRETWGLHRPFDFTDWFRGSLRDDTPVGLPEGWEVDYRAAWEHDHEQNFWRPSIHMPRWASRITLEVTGVRVERLQDISEEDARAEGVSRCGSFMGAHAFENYAQNGPSHDTARDSFMSLWDSINAKRAPWSSNPWVWVVSFKRVEGGTP